mmetsp:Transcript_30776/g.88895  ORF Transcript_30776/g.88895 Transcript_30776/m.88895 type:complete len:271 (-) Transcript_30776:251-1063(-)
MVEARVTVVGQLLRLTAALLVLAAPLFLRSGPADLPPLESGGAVVGRLGEGRVATLARELTAELFLLVCPTRLPILEARVAIVRQRLLAFASPLDLFAAVLLLEWRPTILPVVEPGVAVVRMRLGRFVDRATTAFVGATPSLLPGRPLGLPLVEMAIAIEGVLATFAEVVAAPLFLMRGPALAPILEAGAAIVGGLKRQALRRYGELDSVHAVACRRYRCPPPDAQRHRQDGDREHRHGGDGQGGGDAESPGGLDTTARRGGRIARWGVA